MIPVMTLIPRRAGLARARPDLFKWTVIGVGACILGWVAYGEIVIDVRPVRTVAEVNAVTQGGRSAGFADVTFTVDGRRVDTIVLLDPLAEDPATGDQILVEYAQWDPVEARIAGTHNFLMVLVSLLFVGLVLLLHWIFYERQVPRFVTYLWHRRFPPRGRRAKT
jgi:hypothetical protein